MKRKWNCEAQLGQGQADWEIGRWEGGMTDAIRPRDYYAQKPLPGSEVMYGPNQAQANLSALALPYKQKFCSLLGPTPFHLLIGL